MDRDHELAADYAAVTKLLERWEKRKQGRVEGDWYLFEQEGRIPKILLVTDGFMVDEPYTVELAKKLGWTATKVIVFKE